MATSPTHVGLRGRDQTRAHSHYRSVSKRVFGQRPQAESTIHKFDRCSGTFHTGSSIRVFSQSANCWFDGEIVQLLDRDFVRVEWLKGEDWYGKDLHMCSKHISKSSFTDCHVQPNTEEQQSSTNLLAEVPKVKIPSEEKRTLFHGCRKGLPLQCGGDAAKFYTKMDFIWTLLEQQGVALVKGTWLLERSKAEPFVPLPCRQDLPSEAVVDFVTLSKGRGLMRITRTIIAISHCWLDSNHPDPHGLLLQEVATVIRAYMAFFAEEQSGNISELTRRSYLKWLSTGGLLFFAWCSLYQPYHLQLPDGKYRRLQESQLNGEQSMRHYDALSNMDIWYANEKVEVWMFTKLLKEERPYSERGWPTWERTTSNLMGHADRVLDLGLLDLVQKDDHGICSLSDIRKTCKSSLCPPLVPTEFISMIDDKHFTCGDLDRELVKQIYSRNFHHVMMCVKKFTFPSMCWSMNEISSLANAMSYCKELDTLELTGNSSGERWAITIAKFFSCCSNLKSLNLSNNEIGDEGVRFLAEGFQHLPKLAVLYLDDNMIGESGAYSLAKGLHYSMNLLTLSLQMNPIGNAGIKELTQSLHKNVQLCEINVNSNHFNDDGLWWLLETLQSCCNMRVVEMSSNFIHSMHMRVLGTTLISWHNLRGLNLDSNFIGDNGLIFLSDGLRHCKCLQVLTFNANQIGDDGASSLAESLQQCRDLFHLELMENQIGDVGTMALSSALSEHKKLSSLMLQANRLTIYGIQTLANTFSHATFHSVYKGIEFGSITRCVQGARRANGYVCSVDGMVTPVLAPTIFSTLCKPLDLVFQIGIGAQRDYFPLESFYDDLETNGCVHRATTRLWDESERLLRRRRRRSFACA